MQTKEASQESEIKQVIRSLCMMNNRFMNFMLDDNKKAAQVFLRIILGDDKIKVRNVRIQSFIQNIYGHSSQLDILAQDSEGRYFNVEVQRSDEGAPARRARFYSSILDTHFLQPSKLYEELPDTYVIFITENDVLRDNLPLYDIRRTIKQSAKDLKMVRILSTSTASAVIIQRWASSCRICIAQSLKICIIVNLPSAWSF